MSFKRKLKRVLKNLIGDFTGIQWKDLDHKKVYALIAAVAAVIVLIIVLIVGAVSGGKDKTENMPQDTQESEVITEETDQTETLAEDPLEVDAYDAVNQLVEKYFLGLSSGDTAAVEEVVDILTDEEKATIERKKDYIESYNNIVCYTKKGLEDNSYVVFASYEMKFHNIETAAPGIMALYVCQNENGEFYIFNSEAPEELTNYVLELAADEEVAAVIADVDARYQQLIAEDEDLGKFAETMLQSREEAESDEPDAPAEGSEEAAELEEPVSTTVNSNVRIREGRSADTAMLDTIAAGTGVKVYANYSDGWSKIEYNGTVGYCKTQFLESTEGVPTADAETSEGTSEETDTAEQTENTEVTAVNKKMQFKETVKIRAERSTDSERIANGYAKELVQVIENYSDGWSKIEYDGKTGYCKTQFLEEAQ